MRHTVLRLLLLCYAAVTPTLATQNPYGCSAHVVVPDGTTAIPGQAYSPIGFGCSCPTMTSLTIPNSVKTIHNSAFFLCYNLATVDLGKGVTEIKSYAFEHTGITSVTIPDSVKSIGPEAFERCSKLATVSIGGGVTSIGLSAFYQTALSGTIVVPRATQIGSNVFPSAVTVLRRVRLPQNIPQPTGPLLTPAYY